MPPALPKLAPPPDDSRRSALCRNPGCPDLGEGGGGGVVDTSGFLAPLAPGPTAAPKGFGSSLSGLEPDFPFSDCLGPGLGCAEFELLENLELRLVIHELRLPRCPEEGDLDSLALLVGGGVDGTFSELGRV